MHLTEPAAALAAKARDLVGHGTTTTHARRSLPIFSTPEELEAAWSRESVRRAVLDGLELEPERVTLLFAPGRPGWGNEATAELEFDEPVPESGAGLLAGKLLRRLKSLIETGEIPTTEHNPAARQV